MDECGPAGLNLPVGILGDVEIFLEISLTIDVEKYGES